MQKPCEENKKEEISILKRKIRYLHMVHTPNCIKDQISGLYEQEYTSTPTEGDTKSKHSAESKINKPLLWTK